MDEGEGGGPEVGEDGLDMKAKERGEPKFWFSFWRSQNEEEEYYFYTMVDHQFQKDAGGE